jgi:hypothetical protein
VPRFWLQGLLGAIAEEVKRRLLDSADAATFSRQHLANFVSRCCCGGVAECCWARAAREALPDNVPRMACNVMALSYVCLMSHYTLSALQVWAAATVDYDLGGLPCRK